VTSSRKIRDQEEMGEKSAAIRSATAAGDVFCNFDRYVTQGAGGQERAASNVPYRGIKQKGVSEDGDSSGLPLQFKDLSFPSGAETDH